MNRHESEALDRHITGNGGEDSVSETGNTTVSLTIYVDFNSEDYPEDYTAEQSGVEKAIELYGDALWIRDASVDLVEGGRF